MLSIERISKSKNCIAHSLQKRLVYTKVCHSVCHPLSEPSGRVWRLTVGVCGQQEHTYSLSSALQHETSRVYRGITVKNLNVVAHLQHQHRKLCTQSIARFLNLYLLRGLALIDCTVATMQSKIGETSVISTK